MSLLSTLALMLLPALRPKPPQEKLSDELVETRIRLAELEVENAGLRNENAELKEDLSRARHEREALVYELEREWRGRGQMQRQIEKRPGHAGLAGDAADAAIRPGKAEPAPGADGPAVADVPSVAAGPAVAAGLWGPNAERRLARLHLRARPRGCPWRALRSLRPDKFILDGKTPVEEPDLLRWAFWMETADRSLKLTIQERVRVSTNFLGLDQNFGHDPPLLFETMTFIDGEGWTDLVRYSTWDEAEAGHAEAVRRAISKAYV